MGLLARIALLPLAPVQMAAWAAGVVLEQADSQYLGPEALRRQLRQLQAAVEAGELSEEEYAAEEEAILDALEVWAERGEGGEQW
jgi:hypothetical protein